MATLQRPALRRTAATQPIRASFFDDSNDARNSPQAQQLREQITTVYGRTPFKGPAFQLPSGAVVVEDMWAASLNTTIDEILDSGLDGLKVFADQTNPRGWVLGWLGHKVRLEGTDEQKQMYEQLRIDIITPEPQPGPMPIVPEPQPVICRGLPADLMDFQPQPLREVEVYRDLGGFEMPEEAKPEGDEDEEELADAPAPAEGA